MRIVEVAVLCLIESLLANMWFAAWFDGMQAEIVPVGPTFLLGFLFFIVLALLIHVITNNGNQ